MFFGRGKRKPTQVPSDPMEEYRNMRLCETVGENEKLFRGIFEGDNTVVFRAFGTNREFFLLFVDGMIDSLTINNSIISPAEQKSARDGFSSLEELAENVLSVNDVKITVDIVMILDSLLYGDAVLLADGFVEALVLSTKGFASRGVPESQNEKGLRGPQEAFAEAFMTNLSLIRRKLRTPALKFAFRKMGKVTRTNVVVCYIDGLADKELLSELDERLSQVEANGILDSNLISEKIRDHPFSPFKTIGTTERPDVVAARLMEGRVAVIVDGSPTVLTLPHLLMEHFQSQGDYYGSFWFASLTRIIRYIGFFISVSAPALYSALLSFHPDILPTSMIVSISQSRQGVMIPTVIEILFMLVALTIMQEAGLRSPPAIGASLSIVGGLILGQSAVDVHLVSAPVVIIVAVWTVTNMMLPSLRAPVIVMTFILLMLSSVMGLYGYVFGLILAGIHTAGMRSFGVPFMDYIVPYTMGELRDGIIRAPWRSMEQQPVFPSSKAGEDQ